MMDAYEALWLVGDRIRQCLSLTFTPEHRVLGWILFSGRMAIWVNFFFFFKRKIISNVKHILRKTVLTLGVSTHVLYCWPAH